MTATNHYYTEHAQDFFDSTVKVDIGKLYQRFLPRIPENGAILDAGCGSGRDSKNFLDLGYDVTAFDANRSLVQLASEHMGQEVLHSTFQNFDAGTSTFDGIWACASLLHVTTEELPTVFTNLSRFLKSGGILYCSFKYGDVELVRNGRYLQI